MATTADFQVDWGALASPPGGGTASVDLGNWLLVWFGGLRTWLRHARFSKPAPFAFRHQVLDRPERLNPRTRTFLHCLPGVGRPLPSSDVPPELLQAHDAPWESSLCCSKTSGVHGLLAAQPLLRWALQRAWATCSVRVTRTPGVLHLRCGDAPFSRHGTYHFLRHSGYVEMVARLRGALELEPAAPMQLHVVTCFRHEQPNNWDSYVARFEAKSPAAPAAAAASNGTRASGSLRLGAGGAVGRACGAYIAELLALLKTLGVTASVSECEGDMVSDFALMAHAPALLSSSTSSFGFLAGFAGAAGLNLSQGTFQMAARVAEARSACGNGPQCAGKDPAPPRPPERCLGCEHAAAAWMVPSRHVLLHREVPDYYNTSHVIELLRTASQPWSAW